MMEAMASGQLPMSLMWTMIILMTTILQIEEQQQVGSEIIQVGGIAMPMALTQPTTGS